MDLWHHLVEVWEYFVEHFAEAVGFLFGFDPKPFLPWAQLAAAVSASIVSGWGIFNIWNHFDSRKRKLLVQFLIDEEKKILEAKSILASRFLQPRKSSEPADPLDVHERLNSALAYFDAGKIVRAERELTELEGLLTERHDLAVRQSSVALMQSGAVHLFLGSISASQGKLHEAVKQFKRAIHLNNHDLDARKYLVEQLLTLSQAEPQARIPHLNQAIQESEKLVRQVPTSDVSRCADAYRLLGLAQLELGSKGNARTALTTAGELAEKAGDHALMALIFEKLGVAHSPSNHIQARQAFGKSITSYENSGRGDEADRVRKLRDELLPPTIQQN